MANVVEIILRGKDQLKGPFRDATKSMAQFRAAALATAKVAAGFATAGTAALAGLTLAAARNADQMAKTARAAGFQVEEFSRLAFAAKLGGVELELLRTGLVTFNRAIVEASGNIQSRQARAFQALGIQIRDANGDLRSNSELLAELSDRFAGYRDGAEKSALAMQLFGDAGARMIPLLNQGSEEIRRLGQETVGVDQATADAAEMFNDNLTKLGRALSDVGLVILKEIGPALAQLSGWLVKVQKESNAFGESAGFVVRSITTLARGLSAIGFVFGQLRIELKAAGELLGSVFVEALDVAEKQLKAMISAVGGLGRAIGLFLRREFGQAADVAAKAVKETLGGQIMESLVDAGQNIRNDAAQIFDQAELELRSRKNDFDQFLQNMVNESPAPGVIRAPLVVEPFGGTQGQGPPAPVLEEADAQAQLNTHLNERKKLLSEIELLRSDSHAAELARISELGEFQQTFAEISIAAHQGWISFVAQASQTAFQGISSAITNMITGITTAEEAVKALGRQMISMVVNFIAQRLVAFALEKVLQAASLGLQKAALSVTVGLATAAAAAWAPAATASLIATGGASSSAAAALPKAMALNAGIAASLAALGGAIGGAAHGGMDFVPREQTFLLNRGERVVQPSANRDLTEFLSEFRAGGSGPTLVQINLDGQEIYKAMHEASRDGRLTLNARAII